VVEPGYLGYRNTVVFSPETTDLGTPDNPNNSVVTGDSAGRQLLQWLEEQDPSIRWWLIPLKWLSSAQL